MPDTRLTVGEYVSATLALNGIRTVFGIPGVHTLELYRGLAKSSLQHVLVRHEQGAGFAADGYARLSGRPAAAMVISGPGLTNILTALGQAYTDSVPLLVVASTAARHSLGKQWGALHELRGQREIAAAVCGHAGHADRAEDVRDHLKLAFAVMGGSRPRPAYLEIPLDVLSERTELVPERFPGPPARPVAGAAAIATAAAVINPARNPVVIAGGGAAGAAGALREFVEALGAPCLLTTAGKGLLPEGHPLNAGASLPYPLAQATVAGADVVIAVGTELAETDHYVSTLPLRGALVRIDVDPAKLADQYVNTVPVLGDAEAALAALHGALTASATRATAQASAARVSEIRAGITSRLDAAGRTLHELLDAMRAVLPADAALFTDMTQIAYAGNYAFATDQPRTWFHPSGYGTLGYALPAAVGAKLACPERHVVALAGDFGLQFTLHELVTAVEHNLTLPIVLWNNEALGQIRDDMIGAGIPPLGVVGRNPEFVALGRAYGAHALRVESAAALGAALTAALGAPGPTLIEVHLPG
jgi:5-guanidino-2-oxopentanoate decarboxylase